MKLTSGDLEKLRIRQVANIIRKLGAGKTITAHEQKLLDEERDRTDETPAATNFVRTWDDLALELNVSRKSLQNWRAREDLRGLPDFPRPRPDGRHNVTAWRAFMVAHQLNRADETVVEGANADGTDDGGQRSIRDWKSHREQLLCVKLEREILRDDRELLVAIELEIALGQLVAGISVALDHFAPGAARFVVGLRDIHDVQIKLQTEIDAVKQRINASRYLDDCVDEVVAAFPFDDATAGLYAKVSFAGQDRESFLALVRASTIAALRGIGKRCLTDVTAEKTTILPVDDSPPSTPEAKKESDKTKQAMTRPRKRAHSGSRKK